MNDSKARVAFQLRVAGDIHAAIGRAVTEDRGRNRYIESLLRRDLTEKGFLTPAPKPLLDALDHP